MKDYEKTLRDALESKATPFEVKSWIEENFTELCESEGERARKCLVRLAGETKDDTFVQDGFTKESIVAWLDAQKSAPTTAFQPNGVYPGKDGVRIWYDGHTFKVPKEWNKGDFALLSRKGCERSEQNNDNLQTEADAIMDWDFVSATKRIQDLGTNIPLRENEYLPTVPVFLAMYKYREELNAALEVIGANAIDFSESFWLSQRYNGYGAWYFGGNYRYLSYISVYFAFQCVAVAL